jgi:hypothetical protein
LELAEVEQEAGEAVEAVTVLMLHKLGTEAEVVPATAKAEGVAAAVEEQEEVEVRSVVVEVDVAGEAALTARLKEERRRQLPPQQLQRLAIHKLLIPLNSNKHTFRFPKKSNCSSTNFLMVDHISSLLSAKRWHRLVFGLPSFFDMSRSQNYFYFFLFIPVL